MPGAVPGALPGAMPGAVPGAMPGAMPGGMPGAMPGAMPAPEYLRATQSFAGGLPSVAAQLTSGAAQAGSWREPSPFTAVQAASALHAKAQADLGAHASCHPVCTWSCTTQPCEEVCEPVCSAPKCETRCPPVTMEGCFETRCPPVTMEGW